MSDYRLAWHDEFEGSSLDTAEWDFRTDRKMWSTQQPQNVSVSDGRLMLAVKKEDVGKTHYTGGGIISKRLFRYGYYEARFKVPPGAGWHTSFWMMRGNAKGDTGSETAVEEIDVCENDSISPEKYSVNVHRWNPGPHVAMGGKTIHTPDLSKDFHIYGCEFTPQVLRFFFDGKLVQTVKATRFPNGEVAVWLTTIASGLGGTKSVDDAQLPAAAQIDYVRVFTRP